MANSCFNLIIFDGLKRLIEKHIETDDDAIIFEAFAQNDIRHVCQAIRHTRTSEVSYQHMTLRSGGSGEQSVYRFGLSNPVKYALDIYSLYLGMRETRFQQGTFHPELITPIVIPVDINALLWKEGNRLLKQLFLFDRKAFQRMIPAIQISCGLQKDKSVCQLLDTIKKYSQEVWFEVCFQCHFPDFIDTFQPSKVKLAKTFSQQHEGENTQSQLREMVKFFRKNNLEWIVGRITTENELRQFRNLGASHYFGFFSDIPTSLSTTNFDHQATV